MYSNNNLLYKITQVNSLYKQIDKSLYSVLSHLNLDCKTGCCDCCKKPDIYTTVIEFLPLSYNLYLKDKCQIVLDKLHHSDNLVCVFYNRLAKKNAAWHTNTGG
jgi:hypothetical protein